ncbi:hypothetical protein FHT86_002490 [Rhizobium sp. BK313]|uniref:hypothetical protein n=1 Tax=Rhizobium sp. BK313 TaxID=2587081 RepID=UPI00105BD84D|nr:hypothetical protein [Rhizobium sp. BK313]MBB3454234.1 hypothetical protein [Rhizobium sp. BK313]
MGRDVRRVPANWEHPRYTIEDAPDEPWVGSVRCLLADYPEAVARWDERAEKWPLVKDFRNGGWKPYEGEKQSFVDYAGPRPDPKNYMPVWPTDECTHLMMYETTTEGSPISPSFATPEELARWLTDNEASAFGNQLADYEFWLRVAGGATSVAMVTNGKLTSHAITTANIDNPK